MSKMMKGLVWTLSRALQTIVVGAVAVAIIATPFAIADYNATPGSGITMASIIIATKHYFANVLCDPTIGETQCQAVNSSGQASVLEANSAAALAALQGPIPPQVSHGVNIGGVEGLAAAGAAVVGNPVLQGGSDGTDVRSVVTDASGHLLIIRLGTTPTTPFVAAASDNHTVWKNGSGTAMSVHTSNNSATKNYLRLYDAGTGFNGCNSATGVIFAMEIPPNDGGFSISLGSGAGIAFTNGLSVCVTSGFGLTDTTNATASAIYVNASYR